MEIGQQHQYDACKDVGTSQAPKDHKKILAHFFFDVKYDGRHKARLVADRTVTGVRISNFYSGVVYLRVIRLVLFIAERNGIESSESDIDNAYIDTFTKEKVYIVASLSLGL